MGGQARTVKDGGERRDTDLRLRRQKLLERQGLEFDDVRRAHAESFDKRGGGAGRCLARLVMSRPKPMPMQQRMAYARTGANVKE